MLIYPEDPSMEPLHGSLQDGVAVDRTGKRWAKEEVRFILPDDEAQAVAIRKAGYLTHTPLTLALDECPKP